MDQTSQIPTISEMIIMNNCRFIALIHTYCTSTKVNNILIAPLPRLITNLLHLNNILNAS